MRTKWIDVTVHSKNHPVSGLAGFNQSITRVLRLVEAGSVAVGG